MQTFKTKWDGKRVEDAGSSMSSEAKSFCTAFKNMLKRNLEPDGIEIVSFSPNHYDFSGFLERDGKYVYISYSIPRGGMPIDFDAGGAFGGVLYRTAANERDYRGGTNHFSSINHIVRDLQRMFEDYDRYR